MLGQRVFHFAKGVFHTAKLLYFLGDLAEVFVEVLFFGEFGIVGSLEEDKLCL